MKKVDHHIFLSYIIMSETTYYHDVILKRTKDFYKNDKERLRDNARILSEVKKERILNK